MHAHEHIFRELRSLIMSEHYAAGQQLPSERELCASHGVSRITVRHALKSLEESGLIERVKGRGAFVLAGRQAKIPVRSADFSGSIGSRNENWRRSILELRQGEPPPAANRLLELNSDPTCLHAVRLDFKEEEPLAIDHVWIPRAFSSPIREPMLERIDFLECWAEAAGLRLGTTEESIEAVLPDPFHLESLAVSPSTPLLKTEELMKDIDGRPIALFITWYRGDRYRLVSTIRKDGAHG